MLSRHGEASGETIAAPAPSLMNRLKEVINLLESQTSKYPSVVGATLGGAAAIVGASSLNSPLIAALLIVLALLGIKERTRQSRLTGNGADDKAEPLLDTVVVAEHELKDRELEVETLRQRNAELLRRISDLEAQVKAYASQPKPQEVPSAQKRSSSIDIASNSSRASEQSDPSAADPSLLSTSPPAHPPVASLASLAGGALPARMPTCVRRRPPSIPSLPPPCFASTRHLTRSTRSSRRWQRPRWPRCG